MELLRDVDPVLRFELPLLLSEVGLPSHSESLRALGPVWKHEEALSALDILRSMGPALPLLEKDGFPDLEEVLSDCCFWSEGAILAAFDGDIDLFADCLKMGRRALAIGKAQLSVH